MAAQPPKQKKFSVDHVELRKLIDLLKETGLGELEISQGDTTVRVKSAGQMSGTMVSAPASAPAATSAAPAEAPAANKENSLCAPMVGTFYGAPSPEAEAFVKVGDSVKKGQVICIIEAMKTMNHIEAEKSGTVKEILVDNAQPVEFGEPLFRLG